MSERCRDCALYDLPAVLSANDRVLSSKAAKCLWTSTEVWPLSADRGGWNLRPRTCSMSPNDGAGCPCFRRREIDHD